MKSGRSWSSKRYYSGKDHHAWVDKVMNKKCLYCLKRMQWVDYKRNAWIKQKYCSVRCGMKSRSKDSSKNYFWRGGEKTWSKKDHLYSSKKWIKIKKEIMERDKICKICSGVKLLMVHHKIFYKEGGSNDADNLVTLCKSCHGKLHTLEAFYRRNHSRHTFDQLRIELVRKRIGEFNKK